MLDYMTALHLRFKSPSQRSQDLKQQITILHRQLASRPEKPERKMLLRLVDLEDALRDQSNLDSFVSGFRLDSGIQRELLEQPPYSFETEEEQRAREMFERRERRNSLWQSADHPGTAWYASGKMAAGRVAS